MYEVRNMLHRRTKQRRCLLGLGIVKILVSLWTDLEL